MEYILFAQDHEASDDNIRFKLFADYLGSYKDPKRAMEEMKRTQESGSDSSSSTQITYTNANYGKEPPPVIKLESEEEKQRFETEFDKAMKLTFGEGYKETRVVVPSRSIDEPDSDEEPDEIVVQ